MPSVGSRQRIDVEFVRRENMIRQNRIIARAPWPSTVRKPDQANMGARRSCKIACGTSDDRIGGVTFGSKSSISQRQLDRFGWGSLQRGFPGLRGTTAQE